jgi:hypothetical protein
MAKSISGRIEWLSSFGSIIRFDAVSIGVIQISKINLVLLYQVSKEFQKEKR